MIYDFEGVKASVVDFGC